MSFSPIINEIIPSLINKNNTKLTVNQVTSYLIDMALFLLIRQTSIVCSHAKKISSQFILRFRTEAGQEKGIVFLLYKMNITFETCDTRGYHTQI